MKGKFSPKLIALSSPVHYNFNTRPIKQIVDEHYQRSYYNRYQVLSITPNSEEDVLLLREWMFDNHEVWKYFLCIFLLETSTSVLMKVCSLHVKVGLLGRAPPSRQESSCYGVPYPTEMD